MTDYNPIAVDKAIDSSNRHGHKIGKGEAKQIHRLLAGRKPRAHCLSCGKPKAADGVGHCDACRRDFCARSHRAPRSFKAEVQTYSCAPDAWTSNMLRFDTEASAESYARDLAMRWTAVKAWRVVPCSDPATDSWQDNRRASLPWGTLPGEST
jgi:ribosomal protein L37AE/L43A